VLVRAKATVDGREVVAFASTAAAVSQGLAGLPYPPRTWLRGVGVAVLPKPPVTLSARWEPPEAVRGLATALVVTAEREKDFDGDVALSLVGLPPNVTAAAKTIPKGQTEARVEVKLNEKAPLGSYAFSVVGRAQAGGREAAAVLLPPPLAVVPPFELKAEPNPLTVHQGGKAALTVTAARKGGYGGPITVELRNLPANVTATKAQIAAGQPSAQLDLAAAAAAPTGARGDVDVLGSITLGQQQAASPPFTVRVQAPPPPPALALKAEPAAVTLKAGGKAKVKVAVEQTGAPFAFVLTVEGLPPKVAAPAVTVPAGQASAELELTAAADAEPAKAELTVKAGGGPVAASVKVALTVEK